MKAILVICSTLLSLSLFSQSGYKIGDKAEDFSLRNVNEKFVSLSDYPDSKGFIVMFICNHCPYVVAYEDRIIAIDKKYSALGYPVIAINPNDPEVQPGDSFEKMQEKAKDKQYTFPYLFDEKQDVYPKYGATKTPHVYVLQKNKNDLIVKYIGTIDDNFADATKVKKRYLENAIDALLSGKEPNPSSTKAIGCTIKKK